MAGDAGLDLINSSNPFKLHVVGARRLPVVDVRHTACASTCVIA